MLTKLNPSMVNGKKNMINNVIHDLLMGSGYGV